MKRYDVVFEHRKTLKTKYENVNAASSKSAVRKAGHILFKIRDLEKIIKETNYNLAYVKEDKPMSFYPSVAIN